MNMFSVLRNAGYRKLFFGLTVSKLGDWFFMVSLPLLVYELTESGTGMALAFVIEILPQVLFALIGGALADQVNKKKMLVWGDLGSALIVSLIPLLYFTGHLEVWMVYAVAFLLASVTAFYHPSFESIIPEIVEKEELVKGNSLMRLTDTMMTFIGPAIAGVSIAMLGKVETIMIDGVSFFLASVIMSTISYAFVKRDGAKPKILEPIKEGLRFVRNNERIMAGSWLIFGINVGFGAVEALFMYYLADDLKLTSSQIGLVLSFQAIGPLGAAYLANRLKQANRGYVMIISGLLIGAAQIGLIFSQSFIVALLICQVIIKGAVVLLAINWFTLRQEIVPREMLGRVISSTRMIAFLALPLSGMIAGLLVEHLSIRTIFVTAGSIVVLCSLLGLRSSLVRTNANLMAETGSQSGV
ncbi:MAG TPA: MFS transporter [Bacilli bacterium]|nr:MFS transporter [Bacilli bacterium]